MLFIPKSVKKRRKKKKGWHTNDPLFSQIRAPNAPYIDTRCTTVYYAMDWYRWTDE